MIILKLIAFLSGSLFIYAGIFVYPDERKELHNRLENIWLKLSYQKDEFDGHTLSASKISAEAFSNFFTYIFGKKLISRQSIMTSTILSAWLSPVIAIFAVIFYQERAL